MLAGPTAGRDWLAHGGLLAYDDGAFEVIAAQHLLRLVGEGSLGSSTGGSSTLFWVTSRAAETTALVLSSVAVGVGLTMGGKLIKRGGPDRRTLHEILSLSTMAAIAIHGLWLLGDTWLHPSLLDVTLPFAGSDRTFVTSIGIIAGWGTIILGLSYYARKRIGHARWKLIHRFTALAGTRPDPRIRGGHRCGEAVVHRADRGDGRAGARAARGAPHAPAGAPAGPAGRRGSAVVSAALVAAAPSTCANAPPSGRLSDESPTMIR